MASIHPGIGGPSVKRILIVCGTGIATSTVIAEKVREHCRSKGLQVTVDQTKVSEILRGVDHYDLVVSTTQVPSTIEAPVVNGLAFLTGIGVEAALSEIDQKLSS
jgi:PTS system galactitol-specific IIB component